MKATTLVTIDIPYGADQYNVVRYIREAVSNYKGGLDPQDPMFYLDSNSVEIDEVIVHVRMSDKEKENA